MRHGKQIERRILDNENFKYDLIDYLPNALAWGGVRGMVP